MNIAGFSNIYLQYFWMAVSIVSTAVYFVLTSAYMQKNSAISINFVLAATHGFAALLLLVFSDYSSIFNAHSYQLWKNLLLVALLTWTAKIFYFYAYSRIAVANVTVFSALTPLYAVLISPLMGYPLTAQQILGVTIITGSVFIFFAKDVLAHGKVKWVIPSFAVTCAFLSTIPTAVSTYFQKDAILLSNPINVSFFICAFSSVASFGYLWLKSPRQKEKKLPYAIPLRPLVIIALLQATAAVAFSAYMVQGHPAVGQAVQRLSSLLQILLAHVFLRQRLNTAWHLLCVGSSIIGLYVLYSV